MTGKIQFRFLAIATLAALLVTLAVVLPGVSADGDEDKKEDRGQEQAPPTTAAAELPGAPTNLTAKASGPMGIDLSWSAPANNGGAAITGYRIEVSTDGSAWSDLVADTGSTTTSYSHTGLTLGDTRHYRVSAINSAGTGSASNIATATTVDPLVARYDTDGDGTIDRSEVIKAINDYLSGQGSITRADVIRLINLYLSGPTQTQPPGAPTNLTATANGQTQIDLSWSEPASDGGAAITGYRIEVSTDGSAWSDLVADTGSTTTTYSHTGLTLGDTRHYRVSAINSAGTGSASNVATATTTQTQPPGAPANLTATANGQTQIDLSWSEPASDGGAAITGYRIEVSTDGSAWSDLVADTGSTATSYSHTGLTSGDTRHYRVSAINSAGTGSASNVATATTTQPPPSGSVATDRAVLVALYNATGGPDWFNNKNWLSDRPLGTWDGVSTDAGGRVTVLDLWANQLTGQMPPELADLSNLVTLNLGSNQLTGQIPPELGGLANLKWLILSDNQLTGEMPPELGDLANLVTLDLSANQLTGQIPPELADLSNLVRLDLSANQLTGEIPPELADLSNLVTLSLGPNQLTGEIPPELADLSNLESLWLDSSQLTGEIPPELGDLANLESLNLGPSQLTGEIPPELGDLSNLESLDLSDNQLTGQIPPELGGLANLESLRLGGNQFTGCVPEELRGVLVDPYSLNLPYCTAESAST